MNTTERIGVSRVQAIVYEQLHWIFREQSIDDCGIDAHIEVKDEDYATGKLIAVQIKSGESYFKNEINNEITYYIDERHFNYWKSNVLPVIIVLYNPETYECIWEYFGKVKENRKLFINKAHVFNEKSKDELAQIANIKPYEIAQINRRNYIENNKSLDILHELTFFDNGKQKNKNVYQIAIDFGTTRTIIGIISKDGKISIIKTKEGKNYFDTVIGFDENYQYYIGTDALKRKNNQDFVLIRNFKRELGLNKEYRVFGLTFSSEDITILYIQKLIDYIEIKYGSCIEKCCISNPIDFSYYQKKAYAKCIKSCNLSIVRTIQESISVAIDEEISQSETNIVVIDMGGGTFDISLIGTGDGLVEVMKVGGDRTIGGVDYDYALGEYIKRRLLNTYPGILMDSFLENQIVFKAEEVKILLSALEKTMVVFTECYHIGHEQTITCYIEICRNDFRDATDLLNNKIENILRDFKEQIERDEYNQPIRVMLGGLGSKIFTVMELIKKYFANIPITDIYSDKKSVEGMALYLGKIQGVYNRDILLMDVLGYDIILKGIFYAGNTDPHRYIKNPLSSSINRMPLFKEDEIKTELKIAFKEFLIPFKLCTYIGVTCNQEVAVLVETGKHREKILTYSLRNIIENTIFKIEIDVDVCGGVNGIIKDVYKQNIIWKFTL